MATFNGNGNYIDLDGTQIDTYFREVKLSQKVDGIDATAGSSSTYRERLAGLKDTSGTIKIVYDDGQFSTHIGLLAPGIHTLTYGPEGNASGKPKHVQSILISELPITTKVDKSLVELEVSFDGAAAPSTDLFSGGTWA